MTGGSAALTQQRGSSGEACHLYTHFSGSRTLDGPLEQYWSSLTWAAVGHFWPSHVVPWRKGAYHLCLQRRHSRPQLLSKYCSWLHIIPALMFGNLNVTNQQSWLLLRKFLSSDEIFKGSKHSTIHGNGYLQGSKDNPVTHPKSVTGLSVVNWSTSDEDGEQKFIQMVPKMVLMYFGEHHLSKTENPLLWWDNNLAQL